MEFDAFSSGNTQQDLAACGTCGRSFNLNALSRHEPVCAKSSQKKRKVFDTAKQRAEGTEIKLTKDRPRPGQPPPRQPAPAKKNNWRAKHEDFISTIRAARGVQECIDSGKPLPPPPPPTINPDYIQCQYCSRRFAESAAERHIGFCKEQHARKPRTMTNTTGLAKQNARLGYKAPRLGKKTQASPTSPPGPGYGPTTTGYGRPPPGRSATSRVPLTSTRSAGNTAHKTTPGRNASNGMSRTANHGGYGERYESDDSSPGSGRALRTGRTAETYSEARELSAKQRQGMTKRYPSNESLHRYGNSSPKYGYNGSSPASSAGRPGSGRRMAESGYHSNSDESRGGSSGGITGTRAGSGIAKFCHECGTKYPVPHAKFCCECGRKRVMVA